MSRKRWHGTVELFKDAGSRWVDDKCYRLGAALAYYALFSLFPLALLAVTIFAYVLGDGAEARAHVVAALDPGTPEGRALLDQTLAALQSHRTARGIGAIVGFVTLLFGASGAFGELDSTINMIWRCPPRPTRGVVGTVIDTVRDKGTSFLLVAAAGILVIASVVSGTALTAIASEASRVVPAAWAFELADLAGSTLFLTAIFAALFHFLPSCRAAWRDVAPAALLTTVLFTVLRRGLAWYLAHIGSYAAYGAVGGVLGLLTWIYLVSLVVFFGAEFAHVYAERVGTLANRTHTPAPAPRPSRPSHPARTRATT